MVCVLAVPVPSSRFLPPTLMLLFRIVSAAASVIAPTVRVLLALMLVAFNCSAVTVWVIMFPPSMMVVFSSRVTEVHSTVPSSLLRCSHVYKYKYLVTFSALEAAIGVTFVDHPLLPTLIVSLYWFVARVTQAVGLGTVPDTFER